jgi:hypothetical protein
MSIQLLSNIETDKGEGIVGTVGSLILCPHCGVSIEVLELNCRIFRCGVYVETGEQINPHLPKKECDELYDGGKIYGCGKPFMVDSSGNACICDYI